MGGGAIDIEMESKAKISRPRHCRQWRIGQFCGARPRHRARAILHDGRRRSDSQVEWDLRSAVISGEDGRVVFEQKDVEVPRAWSQTATNVVVSKYFRGPLGTPRRETSVRQLIARVVDTIAGWGEKQGYFADADARETFHAELSHLLLQPEGCRSTARSTSTSESRPSRSARPASSSRSTTPWSRS